MGVLRVVLGDQLTTDISALSGLDRACDTVLMMEVAEEGTYVAHHKQKIVMILSAMRHFARGMRDQDIAVDYVALDDAGNTGSFTGEIARAVSRHNPQAIVMTEPGEWRLREAFDGLSDMLGLPVMIREDDRFFASHGRFSRWAKGRKTWRMEHFYRDMRRETGLLMDGDKPAGGAWNFDSSNRKALPKDFRPPERRRFEPDDVTRKVMALVEARFPDHFGTLDAFGWPVTRKQAREALDDFIDHALPAFGDYQDAMKAGAPFLHHALLAPAIHLGLLSPREVCQAAQTAWREGRAPINAVEGFIRQILGWREYIRGVYWNLMPDYAEGNALGAEHPLPSFYWTGKTDMRCMREAIESTRDHAYSHHIQRLMVTGNFALLAGIAPREIERWYLAVYADAFEWVELPNTLGMTVLADGGRIVSKPYAASGAYIHRMSDFCKSCAYDVKQKEGPRACPFNHLYWSFMIRNRSELEGNPRLAMPYRTLDRMGEKRQADYLADSSAFLETCFD